MIVPAAEHRPLTIVERRYSDPVVRALEAELQQEYVQRYGTQDTAPILVDDFTPPSGIFLVGFVANEPVVTGGFRQVDEGVVEIKRMYVVDDFRGSGYARQLLAALEERAVAAGFTRTVLETGPLLHEAVALYRSSGYQVVEPFGHYRASPDSVFYGRRLIGP